MGYQKEIGKTRQAEPEDAKFIHRVNRVSFERYSVGELDGLSTHCGLFNYKPMIPIVRRQKCPICFPEHKFAIVV